MSVLAATPTRLKTCALAPLLTVLLFALLAATPAGGREPDDATLRPDGALRPGKVELARQAFTAGSVDEAIRLYLEALEEDPKNDRAFWGLVRVYQAAGMDQERLVPMLEEKLAAEPLNMQVKMELAQAHARLGNHDRAHELWWEILDHGTADASLYSDIGAQELRHRMFEHARETYLRGRATFRSTSIYSQELVQVHTFLGDYSSAIDECVLTVENHGGAVQWATNRVEMMLDNGASRREILGEIEALAETSESTPALSFAGSVLLVLDLPEPALAAFLRADEFAGGTGKELLEYASILKDQGLAEESRAAFIMVVERHPGTASAARAGLGAARILANSGAGEEAVTELRAVADIFDGSSVGADALFEAAKVELDVLRNPGAALATVAELRDRFGSRARKMSDDATLLEVDAHMIQGEFERAYERTGTLVRDDVRDDIRESAMFALGFISFLRLDMEKALEEFRAMVEDDAGGVLVNDALRLMLVIADAQETGVYGPVNGLAAAHASRLTGDTGGARSLLAEITEEHAGTAVSTEALMMLGAMSANEGETWEALDYYARVIEETEAITPRAEAMMRRGDILAEDSERRDEALVEYGAILESLPPNILSGEARRKIDRLRRGGVEG